MTAAAPRVAVLDYDMGNRRSVEKALQHVGALASITRERRELEQADGLVLPGVGAFTRGMQNLRGHGLDSLLRERAAAGTPLLGICLGMQLLFDSSTELGELTPGLGLIAGEVQALRAGDLRVPHIGWNEVRFERACELTAELPTAGAPFYHVHSYVAHPADADDVIGTTVYGDRFATIVKRGAVYGTQFHPEKSSRDGLTLLASFVGMVRAGAASEVLA